MDKECLLGKQDQNDFDGFEVHNGEYATGKYNLLSVVTHQGRSADGGHYICWSQDTRQGNLYPNKIQCHLEAGNDKRDVWLKYDDDQVSEHDWGSFDLCGGRSDYHIAVLLLYKISTFKVNN